MNTLLIRRLSILIGMALISILGPARSTLADITITASAGGPATTIASATGSPTGDLIVASSNNSIGAFTINVQSGESNQTASLAELLAASLKITNNSSGIHTLTIVLTATGYTSPLSGTATSQIGGSVPVGSSNNALTFSSNVGGNVVNNPSPDITGTSVTSFNSSASGSVSGLSSPYSITETIVFTLGGNSQINYASSTTVTPVTATPEPATLAMALTALPVLGVASLIRRRRQSRAHRD